MATKRLKIFLSETTRRFSVWLGRNGPLVTVYQDCSSHHDSSKNVAARGRGLFSLYVSTEILKKLLVKNHRTSVDKIWQKCFFGDPLPRLFKASWAWEWGGGRWGWGGMFIFPIYLENFKNVLVLAHLTTKSYCEWPRSVVWRVMSTVSSKDISS